MNRQQRRAAERRGSKTGAAPLRCLDLYLSGAPAEQWRDLLRVVWVQHDGPLIAAAARRGVSVIALLRAAEFAIPADLPEEFPVWRASWGDPAEAAKGFSWTPDRWAAFALAGDYSFRTPNPPRPIVVHRLIRRDQVVFYNEGVRDEIVFDAPPAGEVDGTEEDWREATVAVRMGML